MATAWFLCQYKRRLGGPRPARYCAMDDFTAAITADSLTIGCSVDVEEL